jgi:hypothetical protein
MVPGVQMPPRDAGMPSALRRLAISPSVGDKSYEVRVFQPCDDESWDALLGSIHLDEEVIWARWPPNAGTRETLLHEVLHAVDDLAGTEAGERVVAAWAPILLDALRANPELAWLLLSEDELRSG